mmetsp:Transcript_54912/g.91462  ORF Transcript_54912/g.91462 Transcript_54912/m.91462 type:complete len:362 (-) Transcript_54912:539-1624(-)
MLQMLVDLQDIRHSHRTSVPNVVVGEVDPRHALVAAESPGQDLAAVVIVVPVAIELREIQFLQRVVIVFQRWQTLLKCNGLLVEEESVFDLILQGLRNSVLLHVQGNDGVVRHQSTDKCRGPLIADLVLSQIDVHNRLVLADSFSEGLGPGKCDGIAGKIHLLNGAVLQQDCRQSFGTLVLDLGIGQIQIRDVSVLLQCRSQQHCTLLHIWMSAEVDFNQRLIIGLGPLKRLFESQWLFVQVQSNLKILKGSCTHSTLLELHFCERVVMLERIDEHPAAIITDFVVAQTQRCDGLILFQSLTQIPDPTTDACVVQVDLRQGGILCQQRTQEFGTLVTDNGVCQVENQETTVVLQYFQQHFT